MSMTFSVKSSGGGACGRFEGTLHCAEDGENALVMTEDGDLDWMGLRRPAFRVTRLVVPGDEPGLGQVMFEDGRHFHDLDLRSGEYEPTHPCAPDVYRGRFVAHGPDEWSYEWLVGGPRKDLRLTSRLSRQRPANR